MARNVVIGPPGTGKTTYLMGEIDKMLRLGMQPKDIAFVSFSRNAISEAVARVAAKTGRNADEFKSFKTMHSLFYRACGFRGYTFMTRADQRDFYANAGYGASLEDEPIVYADTEQGKEAAQKAGDDELADELASVMDPQRGDKLLTVWEYSRQRMCDLGEAIREKEVDCSVFELQLFGERYTKFKNAAAKLDHTDVLERALKIKATTQCPVLIVDEAQDLSPLQIALVSLSVQAADDVWIAGDDDQAIYSFQGAAPDWLISLWNNKAWTTTLLDVSHRCPEHVRVLGSAVASRCSERIDKEYKTKHNRGSTTIRFWHEAVAAINELAPGEKAYVMARTNAFCADLCAKMYDSGIVYFAERSGGGPNPMGREELIKAATMLQDVALGQTVDATELRLMIQRHVSTTYYHRTAVDRLKDYVTVCAEDLCAIGCLPLVDACARDVWDVLEGKARKRRDRRNDVDWLRRVWRANGNAMPEPRARVMTYHASKGSEAELVIIDTSLHGRGVHALRKGGTKADAEHRAAYVAVTRSKRDVIFLAETQAFAKARYAFR